MRIRGWWNWLCLHKHCGKPSQAFKVHPAQVPTPVHDAQWSFLFIGSYDSYLLHLKIELFILYCSVLHFPCAARCECSYRILSRWNLFSYNLKYLTQNQTFNTCCWPDNTHGGHSSHTLEHSFNGHCPIQRTQFIHGDSKNFLKRFYFVFLERQQGREKENERNINVRNTDQLPLVCVLTRDWTRNPGMCPDQELSLPSFVLRNNAQPTEPHWSGQRILVP